MAQYDAIVIGAGHNGLVCAAYLARSGQKVLVLEAAEKPGGLAADREFHPGFHASIAHSISHFSAQVAKDLNLAKHGFDANAEPMATIGLHPEGENVVLQAGELSGAGEPDATTYKTYAAEMQRFADALAPSWQNTMPRIGSTALSDLSTFAKLGLKLRLLGKKDMREFMRVATLPMRDLMDENFESELARALLSWDGMIGAKLAPRSPNSAVLSMLYRLSGASKGAHMLPAGGVAGLANALSAAARAYRAEIRYEAPVSRILVTGNDDGLRATGVQLGNGEKIDATRVISATDPQRTFLNLVGVEYLDIGFSNRIRRLRCKGLVAKLHLALNGAPQFGGVTTANGRMIIAPTMDSIEFNFDHSKYGECPTEPVMEIVVPSMSDASLAPDGQHVLSAHVMYVPYELKGGWTDTAKAAMSNRVIETIARYAPGIREQILHSEFLTPADLESEYRVTGGHWHHTEMAMDQMLMMRPTYEAAQYKTPIPGLYLSSAGCHPGGDLVGSAGYNAAQEILR